MAKHLPEFFGYMRHNRHQQNYSRLQRFPDCSKCYLIITAGTFDLIDGVDQFHDRADGGIEMETVFDIYCYLTDSLMSFAPQGFELTFQIDACRQWLDFFDVVKIFLKDAPQPSHKTEGAFHTLIAPFQVFLRRRGYGADYPRRIRAVGFYQIIGIDNVLERFRHFFRLADNYFFPADVAFAFGCLLREKITMLFAFQCFFTNHALRQQIGERFVHADHTEVAQHLGVKARIEQMPVSY